MYLVFLEDYVALFNDVVMFLLLICKNDFLKFNIVWKFILHNLLHVTQEVGN